MEARRKEEAVRRPKMEPAELMERDEARVRVMASGKPSLKVLCDRLGGWSVKEVSGKTKK